MGKLRDRWGKAVLGIRSGLGMGEIVRGSIFPAENVYSLLPQLTDADRVNFRNNFIFFEARENRKKGYWQVFFYRNSTAGYITPVVGHSYDGVAVSEPLSRDGALRELLRIENAAQTLHKKYGGRPHGDPQNQNINHIFRVMAEAGKKRTRKPPQILRRDGNLVYGDFSARQDSARKKRQSYQK